MQKHTSPLSLAKGSVTGTYPKIVEEVDIVVTAKRVKLAAEEVTVALPSTIWQRSRILLHLSPVVAPFLWMT
jgi:hypothetical protein